MIIETASFNEVVKFISQLEMVDKEELHRLITIDIEEYKKDEAIKANPNDPLMNFRRQLNKENQQLFDDILTKIIKIEEGYNLYKKQCTSIKLRIKKARKKLAEMKEENEKEGKTYWNGMYMESNEIKHIESKYPPIDKAILSFKDCKKQCTINLKKLIGTTFEHNYYLAEGIKYLPNYFYRWEEDKRKADTAIRVVEKHFRYIQDAFDSDKKNKIQKILLAKQAAERANAAAALAAVATNTDTPIPPAE